MIETAFLIVMSLVCLYFLLCSYNKVLEAKEELEQKHLHLLQILDSERQAKWHYVQQTEELAMEVKKLKAEVNYSNVTVNAGINFCAMLSEQTGSPILHLQSFFPSCDASFSQFDILKGHHGVQCWHDMIQTILVY